MCIYDLDHLYALQIGNTAERDPYRYEATTVLKQM